MEVFTIIMKLSKTSAICASFYYQSPLMVSCSICKDNSYLRLFVPGKQANTRLVNHLHTISRCLTLKIWTSFSNIIELRSFRNFGSYNYKIRFLSMQSTYAWIFFPFHVKLNLYILIQDLFMKNYAKIQPLEVNSRTAFYWQEIQIPDSSRL